MNIKADIGIFGGSGFYNLFDDINEISIDTPYGKPSDNVFIADYKGKKIAFLPRHGRNHTILPHLINYRANLYAMKQLGVKKIIGPFSVGSLQHNIKPGDLLICDQFVDRTKKRKDTFFEGPEIKHISPANMYCSSMRDIALASAKKLGYTIHPKGTVVVIEGPRYSTIAESRWYSAMGWDVVGMTQYPEGFLAKELGICYSGIALITDYDVGLEGREDIKPVSHEEVLRVFNKNIEKVKTLILDIIEKIDIDYNECCKD